MKKILTAKKAYAIYFLIAIIFVGTYLYRTTSYSEDNYAMYKKYKKYEEKVEKRTEIINKEIDKQVTLYYKNGIGKISLIRYLKIKVKALEEIYVSFKWDSGDTLTREMFLIKKQIILNYVKMHEKMYKCLESKIKYTSKDEIIYIKSLENQYYQKDKLEREKYNLSFDKKHPLQ